MRHKTTLWSRDPLAKMSESSGWKRTCYGRQVGRMGSFAWEIGLCMGSVVNRMGLMSGYMGSPSMTGERVHPRGKMVTGHMGGGRLTTQGVRVCPSRTLIHSPVKQSTILTVWSPLSGGKRTSRESVSHSDTVSGRNAGLDSLCRGEQLSIW